jgi:hypothetical protein
MVSKKVSYTAPKLVTLGSIGQLTQTDNIGSGGLGIGLGGGNSNAHGGNPNANYHAKK